MGRLRLKPADRAPALLALGCLTASAGAWIAIGAGVALIIAGLLACAYSLLVDMDRGS